MWPDLCNILDAFPGVFPLCVVASSKEEEGQLSIRCDAFILYWSFSSFPKHRLANRFRQRVWDVAHTPSPALDQNRPYYMHSEAETSLALHQNVDLHTVWWDKWDTLCNEESLHLTTGTWRLTTCTYCSWLYWLELHINNFRWSSIFGQRGCSHGGIYLNWLDCNWILFSTAAPYHWSICTEIKSLLNAVFSHISQNLCTTEMLIYSKIYMTCCVSFPLLLEAGHIWFQNRAILHPYDARFHSNLRIRRWKIAKNRLDVASLGQTVISIAWFCIKRFLYCFSKECVHMKLRMTDAKSMSIERSKKVFEKETQQVLTAVLFRRIRLGWTPLFFSLHRSRWLFLRRALEKWKEWELDEY